MSVTGKPKIWCPKEDYQTSKGDGISVSTTSGSSSWRSCREIETAMHQASGAKQEEGLFVSEPSRMAVADSVQPRFERRIGAGMGHSTGLKSKIIVFLKLELQKLESRPFFS